MTLRRDDFEARARALSWLLTDADGVLTDGRLYFGPDGEALKAFNARDGLGLKLAMRAGLKVGILSARGSAALETRGRELGLDRLILKREDKGTAFAAFLEEEGVTADQVAYIGDDLPDLAVLKRCGLAFCPADAVRQVRSRAHLVLRRDGGDGAVREAVEMVLEARGQLDEQLRRFD